MDDFVRRDVEGLEDVLTEEVLVRGTQGVSVLQILAVVHVHVLLADVLAPALLDLELEEDCRRGCHIIRPPFVHLYFTVNFAQKVNYLFGLGGHVKESFTDALSGLNL